MGIYGKILQIMSGFKSADGSSASKVYFDDTGLSADINASTATDIAFQVNNIDPTSNVNTNLFRVLKNGTGYLLGNLIETAAGAVTSLSKSGSTLLHGDVTLTGGSNITLTQSGQDISIAAAGSSSPLTTKGDVYTYSTLDARLAVGANGTFITADSAATTGNKWGEGPLTTDGDLMIGATAGTATRLAVGAAGKILTGGTTPAWGQGPMTTTGDLMLGATAGTPTRLAIGTAGKFLTTDGTTASWAEGPLTTAGDLLIGAAAGSAPTRLAVGATAGMYPRSNGSALAYSLGPLTTTGDTLVGATGAEPTRLAMGSAFQSLRVNSGATTIEYAGHWSLVTRTVLGSDTASFTFSSIVGGAGNLMIVLQGRTDRAGVAIDPIGLRFNADAGASQYESQNIRGVNATADAQPFQNTSCQFADFPGDTATASHAGVSITTIPNFAGTTWLKNFVSDNMYLATQTYTSGQAAKFWTGAWNSTAAITTILVFSQTASNFRTGTVCELWRSS